MTRTIAREQQLLLRGAQQLTTDETATCLHVLQTIYAHTTWVPSS